LNCDGFFAVINNYFLALYCDCLAHYTSVKQTNTTRSHLYQEEKHNIGAFSLLKGLDVKQLDKERTCMAWKELPPSIFPGPTEVWDKKRTSRA
jgi:hypothetical protein